MSRRTTKSILSRDEISLLINSEEPKDNKLYGNLYDILLKIQNLKAINLESLIELKLNSIGIAALTYNKQSLLENVKGEWYVENHSAEDPDKKVKCGLCNTPNRYLFYIRNRINNKQLNVGSSCIKNFPGIEGYTEYKYQLNQTVKTQKEIARRIEFHKVFPNCTEIIESSSNYFNSLPILLPFELYFSLNDTVKYLRLIYTKYIKYGKTPTETMRTSFELFTETIEIYNNLKIEADKFIEENINKKFICKRPEINWILQNKKYSLLKKIAHNNGMYCIETIGQIISIDFIKTNFYSIQNALKAKDIKLTIPQNSQSNFQFWLRYGNNLSYNINLKQFMKSIGAYCIFQKKFIYYKHDLMKVSKIAITNKNIEIVIDSLKLAIQRLNYALLIDDKTHTIYLYQKTTKLIKEYSYGGFLDLYDINRIRTNINDIDFVWDYLIKKGKWIPIDIQAKRGVDDKINKLYYHQYIEPYKY